MPSLEEYIKLSDDPAVEKMKNIVRRVRAGEILDLDELLLLYDYFPRLYREYMMRMM